jgi:hypothetical protein
VAAILEGSMIPGPWRWEEDPKDYYSEPVLVGADGRQVCDFGHAEPYDHRAGNAPEGENKRAIEAVPLLIAAITQVMTEEQLDTKPAELGGLTIRQLLAHIKGDKG